MEFTFTLGIPEIVCGFIGLASLAMLIREIIITRKESFGLELIIFGGFWLVVFLLNLVIYGGIRWW
jgi:hypothetical protein